MSFYKNVSVYLFSNILNSAIPFFLLPILTRSLTPDEYGQVAMFQVLLTGVTMFIGLNSVGAANRKYYDHNLQSDTLKEFNGSCIQILLISTLLPTLLTIFFSKELSQFFSIPPSWLYVSILISFLTYIITIRLGQWQIREKSTQFGALQVSFSASNMVLSILFVVYLEYGANGRINAQLVTASLVGLISLVLLYRDKLIKIFVWRPYELKEILSFGIPLIPHNLGFFLITSIDRFIINKELGLVSAGIYMVAVQLSLALSVFFDAVNKAYMPWLFSKLKENNSSDKIRLVKYSYLYFLFAIFLSFSAFIIGPVFVSFIAGEQYKEAGFLFGWLCLGQAFGGMYLIVANYIFYTKKNKPLASITILCGFLNFILLVIMIPAVGLIGAGISYAISRSIQFLLTWCLASKSYNMPWLSIFKLSR